MWQFAPNSVHYLLSLWQRMVASVPYVKASEPHMLETYTPEVTKAYITSRLDSVAVILRSGSFSLRFQTKNIKDMATLWIKWFVKTKGIVGYCLIWGFRNIISGKPQEKKLLNMVWGYFHFLMKDCVPNCSVRNTERNLKRQCILITFVYCFVEMAWKIQ